MPKKEELRRTRDIREKIAKRRIADLRQVQIASERRTRKEEEKFHYSLKQRQRICCTAKAELSSETLDKIECLVGLTRTARDYRESHPVDLELQQAWRELDKPIGQILRVVERQQLTHIREEDLPELVPNLKRLLRMVKADQRKRRGRPHDPATSQLIALVDRLARIWTAAGNRPPARWGDCEDGRDDGAFYPFLRACLKPARIPVSDYVVRQVIERGWPKKTKVMRQSDRR